jgi:hypothetical protein
MAEVRSGVPAWVFDRPDHPFEAPFIKLLSKFLLAKGDDVFRLSSGKPEKISSQSC